MMNLYVQDLLNDFEYEVKQGHYKKMDYRTWRSLNDKRSSLATIEITRDLYSDAEFPDDEITLIVDGLSYVFDGWDRSFGEFLNEFMAMELKMDSSVFDALSAATASASKSTSELLSSIQDNYSSVYYNRDDWSTATSISSNFYEKQPTIEITEQGLKVKGQYVEEIIDEVTGNSIQIRKEKDNMDLIKNFDFGSCAKDNVKVSMYGIAVKNANGTWVSYNPKTGDVMDVDILNFDGKYLYKMPVALKDIKSGDVVIHNRKPMFVSKVEGGKILAIDPAAGEEKVIMLTKNMFGFDFATKVVNLFEGFTGGASADTPFGNMLPLMLMSNSDSKTDDMLPLMFMMNGGKMDMSNPMMMYFLMKDNKGDNDMLPFLLMSNFSGNCNCHCDCDCDREG
jgi:hypothetical protein